ncbi:protein kinase domain-containing protein [Peristeroidobacter agariperforans]|uniref:protein kinase domain-containing protein n=1 Tax=Peristeroidobacter agariperforans TaxID=268404 RepID=UPI00101D8850|nr:protein kinase [Peristeroidobacter agariperforans]
MSAEPSQTTIADAWTQWQSQVVQGRFALRRCLGWSDQGAVFLTEHKAKNLAEAAIKFVRADAPQAQPLLVRWQAAVNLSHAHLVQLFEVGRWQVAGQDYLFVVMEYGDQTLAEILRRRPLSAEEVQELLPPVLDALTFLHRRQLVHSQLKPSNFLAVGDLLKLATDTIRPAGQDHGISTAGDVWSLGATLVEALTARPRISIDQQFDEAWLPAGLPATLVETVRRCLSPSPAERPSIIELRAEYKLAPQAAPASKPEPQVQKVSPVAPPPVPSAPPAAVSPQHPQIVSRVASLTEALPIFPREVPPLQPIQTASRVTVSFHAPPSVSPGIAPPASAKAASQAAASSQPVSSPPREGTSPQAASTASRVAVSSPPVSSAPRDVTPPPPANTASKPAASSQPVPSAPRDAAPAQATNIAPKVAAPAQPTSSAPREAAPPQVANIAPRVADPAQSLPNAQRAVDQAQPANIPPRVVPPAQPIATTPRIVPPTQPAPGTPVAIAPPRPATATSQEAAPTENAPKRHILGIAAGALLLATAVWIGLQSTSESPAPLQQAAVPAPVTPPPAPEKVAEPEPTLSVAVSPPPEQPAPAAATSSSILKDVLPTVPQKIRSEIQGRIYVSVRVLVDPTGNVIGVLMENAGPSKYFARLSERAAREWQFVPADTDAARVWVLEFEYTRDGAAVRTLEQ